jgi:hypothetical protein
MEEEKNKRKYLYSSCFLVIFPNCASSSIQYRREAFICRLYVALHAYKKDDREIGVDACI